jgi:hypothetical protein
VERTRGDITLAVVQLRHRHAIAAANTKV